MGTILVIDDEKLILDLVTAALTLHGYEVEVAANGYEGITKFDRSRYDIVITDLRMPVLDGLSVIHHIRESEKGATPVMGISGTPWDMEGADFDVILEKPFSIKALMEHVAVLGGKGASPASR
jgi:DNA-binding response OmpR family regulator